VEAAAEATLEEAEPPSAGPTPAKQLDSDRRGPGIHPGPLNELDANSDEGGQLEWAEEKEPGKENGEQGGPAEESGQGSETTELVDEETRVERGLEVASGAHADGPGCKVSEGVLGAVSGGQEGGLGVKSGRWEGWQKAGATVRVQKGLGYLAGNAQPPGWEQQQEGGREKERENDDKREHQVGDGTRMGTKRNQEGVAKVQPGRASPDEARRRVGSPQGLQKYLDEVELGEARKEEPQTARSAENREMGSQSQGGREKEGLEVGEGAKRHAEAAPAKRSAKMRKAEEEPVMMEVEKVGPANRGRVKRVGGTAGKDRGAKRDSLEETGEDDEDDEVLAAGGVKKRGQKRAKRRVQIESDEEMEEEVGARMNGDEREIGGVEKAQEPERRDSGGAKGPGEEREQGRGVGGGANTGEVEMGGEEDVLLEQLKGAVKRPHSEDETGEGSDDEVIARLPKSNKRKKGEALAKQAPPKKPVAAGGKKGKVLKQGGAKDSPSEGGAKAGVGGGQGGESGGSKGQAQSAKGAGEEEVKEMGTDGDKALLREGLEIGKEKAPAAAAKMAGGSGVVPARPKKQAGKRRKAAGIVEEKGKEGEKEAVPAGMEEELERRDEQGLPESKKDESGGKERELAGTEGAPKQAQGCGSSKEKKEERQSGSEDEQGPPSGEEALSAPGGVGLAEKRAPGRNALVRAKPKPFVRKVGGGPNRAFRPPGRVNSTRLKQETGKAKSENDESTDSEEGSEGEESAEKDKGKEAALVKRAMPKQAVGKGKRGAAEKKESVDMKESTGKDGSMERKEGAEKEYSAGQGGAVEGANKTTSKGGQPLLGEGSHGQESSGSERESEGGVNRRKGPTKEVSKGVEGVSGNEQLEGDSKEGKGEEVRKKGPKIQGDGTEDRESGGAKNGGKKKRKLASNGTLPVGRRSEGMVTPIKERPRRVSPSKADKEASREESEGDQEAAGNGEEGEDEIREGVACKGQKARGPARKEGVATKGKGGVTSSKSGKAVVLGDANKENIAAGGQVAGAGCEGGKGAVVVDCTGREQQKARYFAFGGTGDQKESMAKKVKVSGAAVEVVNQLIV
jgi:hypothetical protein